MDDLREAIRAIVFEAVTEAVGTAPRIGFGEGEAAALVGLSRSMLAKLRREGRGPACSRIGDRIIYRPADIDDWLLANREGADEQEAAQ